MPSEKKLGELYLRVAESESRLSSLIEDTIIIWEEMLSVGGGKYYVVDLFFTGVLNRVVNLVDAISVLTTHKNFIAACPLIQLLLDSLLRLAYLRATDNQDTFILQILEGKRLDRIKDKDGKMLTDKRLCDYARPIFPQIDDVYEETSKLVHFSDKRVFACITEVEETKRSVEFSVGKVSSQWKEENIVALLECAISVTEAIHAIIRGWIQYKAQDM
jgi:hypothetical protein